MALRLAHKINRFLAPTRHKIFHTGFRYKTGSGHFTKDISRIKTTSPQSRKQELVTPLQKKCMPTTKVNNPTITSLKFPKSQDLTISQFESSFKKSLKKDEQELRDLQPATMREYFKNSINTDSARFPEDNIPMKKSSCKNILEMHLMQSKFANDSAKPETTSSYTLSENMPKVTKCKVKCNTEQPEKRVEYPQKQERKLTAKKLNKKASKEDHSKMINSNPGQRHYSSHSSTINPRIMTESQQCDAILKRLRTMYPEIKELDKPDFEPGSQEEKDFVKEALTYVANYKVGLVKKKTQAPFPSYSEMQNFDREPKLNDMRFGPVSKNEGALLKARTKKTSVNLQSNRNYSTEEKDNPCKIGKKAPKKACPSFKNKNCKEPRPTKCKYIDRFGPCEKLEAPYPSYSDCMGETYEDEFTECKECPRRAKGALDRLWKKRSCIDPAKKPKGIQDFSTCAAKCALCLRSVTELGRVNMCSDAKLADKERIEAKKKPKPCPDPYANVPRCNYEETAKKKKKRKKTGGKTHLATPPESTQNCVASNYGVVEKLKGWLTNWTPQSECMKICQTKEPNKEIITIEVKKRSESLSLSNPKELRVDSNLKPYWNNKSTGEIRFDESMYRASDYRAPEEPICEAHIIELPNRDSATNNSVVSMSPSGTGKCFPKSGGCPPQKKKKKQKKKKCRYPKKRELPSCEKSKGKKKMSSVAEFPSIVEIAELVEHEVPVKKNINIDLQDTSAFNNTVNYFDNNQTLSYLKQNIKNFQAKTDPAYLRSNIDYINARTNFTKTLQETDSEPEHLIPYMLESQYWRQ